MTDTTTRIKICGVRTTDDVSAACAAGAHYVGLMFAEGSPRHITVGQALSIIDGMSADTHPVGVFQNASLDKIATWPHPHIQLHGDEDESFVAALKSQRPDSVVLRGFKFDFDAIRRWDDCPDVDFLLVDGSSGGHGVAFDHSALTNLINDLNTPVFLAGGLNPTTVVEAIQTARPYGVDVSSGVESSRGVKCHELIRAFGEAVHRADTLT